MIHPDNSTALDISQVTFYQPVFSSLQCDDSVQNPKSGRRVVQFFVDVNFAVAPAAHSFWYFDFDYRALDKAPFLDSIQSVEAVYLDPNFDPNSVSSDEWLLQAWLLQDQTSNLIPVRGNTPNGTPTTDFNVCECLSQSSVFSLQFETGSLPKAGPYRFSFVMANFARQNYAD